MGSHRVQKGSLGNLAVGHQSRGLPEGRGKMV